MKPRVLVVDDDPGIRRILRDTLVADGYEVLLAADGAAALGAAAEAEFNAVLLDYGLPDMDGLAVLRGLLDANPNLPVIMVTGQASYELAVKTMKLGAFNFITKPVDDESLLAIVRNAVEHDSLQRQVRHLRDELYERFEMVGTSEAMRRVADAIGRVSSSNAGVLICGESGTGKELVARAIHKQSQRAGRLFVKLNCAAIPQELVESELFGHEKGAFTGAGAVKPGKVEAADKGTLFLDEIGDMALPAQAKLLRFLQEGEFERVGGTTLHKVDARVLAATNKFLEEEIAAKRFREDLYYRLNVVTIIVPPLRDRKEDIPLLAEHFLKRLNEQDGLARKTLSEGAARLLASLSWPGNVRELENAVHRIAVMVDEAALTADNIRPFLQSGVFARDREESPDDLRSARADFEREHIRKALDRTDWNIAAAARLLGIERPSLHRKLVELGITRAEAGQ